MYERGRAGGAHCQHLARCTLLSVVKAFWQLLVSCSHFQISHSQLRVLLAKLPSAIQAAKFLLPS